MAGKVHMENLIANGILYLQDSRHSQIMWSSIGLEFRSRDHPYFHLIARDRAWQHFPGPRTATRYPRAHVEAYCRATYKSLISANLFLYKIVDMVLWKRGSVRANSAWLGAELTSNSCPGLERRHAPL